MRVEAASANNSIIAALFGPGRAAPGQRTAETEPKAEAAAPNRGVDTVELSDSERRQVEKLQARDREVRQHEQAHVAAAGSLFRGGPTYEYQTGPDGRKYAVGGNVQIDTSAVPGDPEATIAKAQQIRRAALAPAEPSGQDRAVAAKANRMESDARQELAEQRQAEAQGNGETDAVDGDAKSDEPRMSVDVYA